MGEDCHSEYFEGNVTEWWRWTKTGGCGGISVAAWVLKVAVEVSGKPHHYDDFAFEGFKRHALKPLKAEALV